MDGLTLRSEAIAATYAGPIDPRASAWIAAWTFLKSNLRGTSDLRGSDAIAAARSIAESRKAAWRLPDQALSIGDLVAAHAELAPEGPSGLRRVPAWFGAVSPESPRILAPQPEAVPEHLADLLAFMSDDGGCRITAALVCHAQLGLIHPFCDGNGRIARLLGRWMLRRAPAALPAFDHYCGLIRYHPGLFGGAVVKMVYGEFGPLQLLWAEAARRLPGSVLLIAQRLDAAVQAFARHGMSDIKADKILRAVGHDLVVCAANLKRTLGQGAASMARDHTAMRAAGWEVDADDRPEAAIVPLPLLRSIDDAIRRNLDGRIAG